MTASHNSPEHGHRRPPAFNELPLVTVLVAAALVLVVGLRGTSDAQRSLSSQGGGTSDQTVAAAGPADGGVSSLADERLAPVGPMAVRSDIATASEHGADTGLDLAHSRTGPGAGLTTAEIEFMGRRGLVDHPAGLRESGSFRRGLRHGDWIALHEDGALRERGAYVDGQQDGIWETFSSAGSLMLEEEYSAGVKQGDWRMFARTGELIGEGAYQQNLRNGRWTLWYSDGSIKERGRYVDGLREGVWDFFDDLGQPTLRSGLYRAGIRIN